MTAQDAAKFRKAEIKRARRGLIRLIHLSLMGK
jgi:hypothetical protein